jgi:amidase
MTDIAPFTPLTEQAALAAKGQVTAMDLLQHSLERIQRLDGDLNAFTEVWVDAATAQAEALDQHIRQHGQSMGPLHGVPVAIKDEYDVAGYRTGLGTNAVTRTASQDSEVVRRLRQGGAVIVGHTNMPEFGQWPFTESTTHGYTRNPWNRAASTAGSSGGSAAAVASGMVPVAIGGDGGGSIRLPSAWCGLFGLKAQRGRVSAAPNRTLWRSLGTIGPLTRTVADAAAVLDVIAGPLPQDPYQPEPWPMALTTAITQDPGHLKIRVALAPPMSAPKLDHQTEAAIRAVANTLAALGHRVEEGPTVDFKLGTTMMQLMGGGVTDELDLLDHPRRLEARTRHGLVLYRALAKLAAKAEADAERRTPAALELFDQVDLLITPTVPCPAKPVGQLDGLGFVRTALAALPLSAYTSIWNVLGNPAAAVPAGFTERGLPLSVQLVAAPGREPLIMQVAAQIERAMPWAQETPAVG